jgi:hypothetical protein
MFQVLHLWAQHVLLAVQGWGQLANLGVLMMGLLAFNSKGSGPYSHGAAGATYRFSFAFTAVFIAWLAYYRIWRLKGADTHLYASKAKNKVTAQHQACSVLCQLPNTACTAGTQC